MLLAPRCLEWVFLSDCAISLSLPTYTFLVNTIDVCAPDDHQLYSFNKVFFTVMLLLKTIRVLFKHSKISSHVTVDEDIEG